MLRHLGTLIPSERPTQFLGQAGDGACDRVAHRLGTVSRKRRPVLDAWPGTMTLHAREVQQHREACRALDQRADRRAADTHDQVAFPGPRHRSVIGFGRPLGDHDVGRDEALASEADTRAWRSQGSLLIPVAINVQNSCRSLRMATDGRPGDRNGGRPHRSDHRFRMPIATSSVEVLRRPVESAQFTSPRFVAVLKDAGVRVSMDGRGRWIDNVFIERLWRSLKYECVYINVFETGSELRAGLTKWIGYYNTTRPRSALAGATPDEAYGQIQAPPYPGLAPDRATTEYKLAA